MRLKSVLMGRDIVPLSEMLAWCKAQRRHASKGTPRHATYDLLVQTLEHLRHEQDVEQIPAPKFIRLCEKARTHAGWARTIPKPEPDAPLPPDHRMCPKCKGIQPDREFLMQATDGQRKVYGWHTKRNTRWVTNAYCRRCRTNRIKRDRRNQKYAYLRSHPLTALILTLRESCRLSRRHLRAACNLHAVNFYEAKTQALANAIDTLEHMLDTVPDAPIPATSDWIQLLKEDERQKLRQLHHTLLMQRLPGRSPTI